MKQITRRTLATAIIAGSALFPTLTLTPQVGAVSVFSDACPSSNQAAPSTGNSVGQGTNNSGNAGSASSQKNGVCGASSGDSLEGFTKTIINTLLYIIGIIAVIMIVIGGIRYTTSNGDANQTKSAKDTILYAVVGMIVAIMAFAIVNFVIGNFGGSK